MGCRGAAPRGSELGGHAGWQKLTKGALTSCGTPALTRPCAKLWPFSRSATPSPSPAPGKESGEPTLP